VEVLEEQNDGMFFEMLPVVFMETQDARMTKVSPKKEHYLFHFIISLRFHSSVSFSSQPLATHGCFQNSKCRRSLWLQSKKKSVGRSVGRNTVDIMIMNGTDTLNTDKLTPCNSAKESFLETSNQSPARTLPWR
jgi:hypothetical protein